MDSDALAALGVLACLLLAGVVVAPAALVSGTGGTLAAYYAAGPVGLTAVGFLALVGVVVFLAARKPHTDPVTVAGVAAVVGVVAFLLAVLWVASLDPTVLFSFPAEYAWLATHRWVVVVAAAVVAGVGGAFARAALPTGGVRE